MRVAIVGTGYVGLTTGVCLASLGHHVRCVDTVAERVDAINAGRTPFYERGLAERLSAGISKGRLCATTDLGEAVAWSEVVFLTVGTPESAEGIDLSYVAEASRQIGAVLARNQAYRVLVVKSTVVPGTTDGLVRRLLEERSGRCVGDFGLCMNPEFLREGSAIDDFMNPDRIVIGQADERSGQVVAAVYASFDCPRVFTTPVNAELIKYASNALLATLVSFSNQMAALCEATPGADVSGVLRGVHLDRRLSPVVDGRRVSPGLLDFLWAGCGFGGSCLPKDVNALRAWARERKVPASLLDSVMTVNAERPTRLVAMTEEAVGSLKGATIAVLGLAFKPGTDDLRESPALKIIARLRSAGAVVRAYDPIVRSLPPGSGPEPAVTTCATAEEVLSDADAAIVATAHPEFSEWNWPRLCRQMRRPVVIDGRNVLARVLWPEGVRYVGTGQGPSPS